MKLTNRSPASPKIPVDAVSSANEFTTSISTISTTPTTGVDQESTDKEINENSNLKVLRKGTNKRGSFFSAQIHPDCAFRTANYDYRYYIQPHIHNEKNKPHLMNASHLNEFLQKKTNPELLLYMPICLYEEIYSEPDQFEDYLTAAVNLYKPTPVHIALVISDELNRYNIFKEKNLQDASIKPLRNSSSLHLNEAEAYRVESKELGNHWLQTRSIEKLAQQLGCKITVFRWGELVSPEMTSDELREIFVRKMEITPPFKIINTDFRFTALLNTVSKQLNSGVGFAAAVQPKLNEVSNKDLRKYNDRTNLNVIERSNKSFIAEEVAHTTQVYATGVFDVAVHAHAFHVRKFTRKADAQLFGEILHHWTCEMLYTELLNQNDNAPKGSTPQSIHLPLYITAGRFPQVFGNKLIVKPQKRSSSEEHTPKNQDPQTPSIHELVIKAAIARGLKNLSRSEEDIYKRSVEYLGQKAQLKTAPSELKTAPPASEEVSYAGPATRKSSLSSAHDDQGSSTELIML